MIPEPLRLLNDFTSAFSKNVFKADMQMLENFKSDNPQNDQMMKIDFLIFSNWRKSKGIYKFNHKIHEEVSKTDINTLDYSLFLKIPEKCVYVEINTVFIQNESHIVVYGFFVSVYNNVLYLRIACEDDGVLFFSVNLNTKETKDLTSNSIEHRQFMSAFLNPLMYLCIEKPDIVESVSSRHISEFTLDRPNVIRSNARVWNVAYRLGAAFERARAARDRESVPGATSTGQRGVSPRPHVRRAHWHTFWTGKRTEERVQKLHWIHPIFVNVTDPDDLPAVIHPVREKEKYV